MNELKIYIDKLQFYLDSEYDLSDENKDYKSAFQEIASIDGLIRVIGSAFLEGESICNLAGDLVAEFRLRNSQVLEILRTQRKKRS